MTGTSDQPPPRPRRRPHQPVTGGGTHRAATDPLASHLAATRLDLPDGTTAPLLAFLDRMLLENEKLNLTGVRRREDALFLHVLDSLQVWTVVARPPSLVLDLGSGNGFPGVAAACLWPAARTILVERTQKKAAAIVRCLADAGLARVEVIALDAAQLPARKPHLRRGADLVLVRALGELAVGIELAAPLMRPAGALLVQWKAANVPSPERQAAIAAAQLAHLIPRTDYEYELPMPEPRPRRLVCFVRP